LSPRTEQAVLQEQAPAKTQFAPNVAAAAGNVAKQKFLTTTIAEAKSVGERAVVFGSLVGMVSFFLPWVPILGTDSGSGLRAPLDVSSVFWLNSLSMLVCFVMSSVLIKTEPKKRILAARWYVIIGTLWFGLGVAAITNTMWGALGFGVYLAITASGTVLVGGMLQISEQLQKWSWQNEH
jgi:hypothetical protein